MDNQRIQAYAKRFQKLIQEKRLDEVNEELFVLINRRELTWDDVYRYFYFIPNLMSDPCLEDIYYCRYAPENGKIPHELY